MPRFGEGSEIAVQQEAPGTKSKVTTRSSFLLQDIMEKVAIAELTLDRKSEDGGRVGRFTSGAFEKRKEYLITIATLPCCISE